MDDDEETGGTIELLCVIVMGAGRVNNPSAAVLEIVPLWFNGRVCKLGSETTVINDFGFCRDGGGGGGSGTATLSGGGGGGCNSTGAGGTFCTPLAPREEKRLTPALLEVAGGRGGGGRTPTPRS